MCKSKLELFMLKRVILFYILLLIADLIFVRQRWIALIGLTVGSFYGLIKFSSMASVFTAIVSADKNISVGVKSIIKYVTNLMLLILLFAISLKINLWLFFGTAAGIIIIPCIIVVNGISEALEITHNNFE